MRKILNLILGILIVLITFGMSHAEDPTNTVTTLPSSPKITPLQLSIWNPVQLAPENWDVWGLRLNLPYGKNNSVYGIDAGVVNYTTNGGVAIQVGVIANWCKKNTLVGVQVSPLFNGSDNFVGIQAGFANVIIGKGNAIQVGFMNGIGLDGNAMQVGFGNAMCSGATVQIGVVNSGTNKIIDVWSMEQLGIINTETANKMAKIDISGLQIASVVNIVERNMTGVKIALGGNLVDQKMTGLQFGGTFLGGNTAGTMNGVQIGLALIPGSREKGGEKISCNNSANDELNGVQIGLWCNRAKTANGLQMGLVNITEKMTGVQIGLVNIIKSSPVPFFPVINVNF